MVKKFGDNLKQICENNKEFENINEFLYNKLGFSAKIPRASARHYLGYDITDYGGVLGRVKSVEAAELKDNEVVLDGGCYKGFLSLTTALLSKRMNKKVNIMGIDLFEDNVKACKKNAELFCLDNLRFYHADLAEVELIGGTDAQIFYRSLREHDINQPEYLDFYGTSYIKILNNTLKYLSNGGRVVIFDTEKNLINLCKDYLEKKSFSCKNYILYKGFLLKAKLE